MRNLLLISVFCFSAIQLSAQDYFTNGLFEQYSGKEGITSVSISKYMLGLVARFADDSEEEDLKPILEKLDGIKVLVFDDQSDLRTNNSFSGSFMQSLDKNSFHELMTIKDGDDDIKFMLQEKDDIISELVMLVDNLDESVMITIQGDIDLAEVSRLAKSMDIDGFEHFEKIGDK